MSFIEQGHLVRVCKRKLNLLRMNHFGEGSVVSPATEPRAALLVTDTDGGEV